MAHQNNEQNLIPFNERTEDERRELASKAGKASGAARRKKRTMKATAKMLFDLPITSKELKQNWLCWALTRMMPHTKPPSWWLCSTRP